CKLHEIMVNYLQHTIVRGQDSGMATLRTLRVDLGWSQTALAKEAGISPAIAKRAEQMMPIRARTARALADALSKSYEREIKPSDIEGLQIL
ncbi:MAG TPA: helix-turn-helix transcriptional regulator, partial [Nitrospiraceae bacterium]